MAIFTTIAIISGVTLLVGGGAVAATYYATEDDRARARIEEIEQEIKNCNTIVSNFKNLKDQLNKGKTYLGFSKDYFSFGGHVIDEVPLANEEFKECTNKINNAITSIDTIIQKYNDQIDVLFDEKLKLEKKL